jgi:hypothetical protein
MEVRVLKLVREDDVVDAPRAVMGTAQQALQQTMNLPQ